MQIHKPTMLILTNRKELDLKEMFERIQSQLREYITVSSLEMHSALIFTPFVNIMILSKREWSSSDVRGYRKNIVLLDTYASYGLLDELLITVAPSNGKIVPYNDFIELEGYHKYYHYSHKVISNLHDKLYK